MKKKIKISSIILISMTAITIAIITAGVYSGISEAKKFFKENGFEITKNIRNPDKGKTFKLEKFTTLVITGKGKITIEQSDKNSFQCFSDNQILPDIKNDTLFIPADGQDNYINAIKLKTIILNKKVSADIIGFKTDTFNINTSDKSQATISNLNVKILNILTEDKSSVELYDLKGKEIETNLVLKDYSTLYIENSNNLNMSIEKDADAKLEIGN